MKTNKTEVYITECGEILLFILPNGKFESVLYMDGSAMYIEFTGKLYSKAWKILELPKTNFIGYL